MWRFERFLFGQFFFGRFLMATAVAVLAFSSAGAAELRFPATGAKAFRLDLPKIWARRADAHGGLLLIPPAGEQRAMLYLALIVDDASRADASLAAALRIAESAAKPVGILLDGSEAPARVTDPTGRTVFHGMAFTGTMPAKRGYARAVRMVILRVAPDTWAQVMTVKQPGMNAAEIAALDRVLNGITLTAQ
jgi:hypothetical protein